MNHLHSIETFELGFLFLFAVFKLLDFAREDVQVPLLSLLLIRITKKDKKLRMKYTLYGETYSDFLRTASISQFVLFIIIIKDKREGF